MSDLVGRYCKLWDDDPEQCEYGIVEKWGYMSGYHANGRIYESAQLEERLIASDWEVRIVDLKVAQDLVKLYHYSKGGANTATYRHGLFRKGSDHCCGVAWWIPPTKSAALATYPERWQGVLALSRLVVEPGVPKNACSFLMAKSMRMIDREKWPCFVTYADEWQGHKGTIYKATNWKEVGKTAPEATFQLDGRMVARKAGPKTRTRAEMENLGAVMVGKFSKTKFVHVVALSPCGAST